MFEYNEEDGTQEDEVLLAEHFKWPFPLLIDAAHCVLYCNTVHIWLN